MRFVEFSSTRRLEFGGARRKRSFRTTQLGFRGGKERLVGFVRYGDLISNLIEDRAGVLVFGRGDAGAVDRLHPADDISSRVELLDTVAMVPERIRDNGLEGHIDLGLATRPRDI